MKTRIGIATRHDRSENTARLQRVLASAPRLPSVAQPEIPVNAGPTAAQDCRCACGSLLARLVAGGVEIKCRRCKRSHRLPLVDSFSSDPDRSDFDAGA